VCKMSGLAASDAGGASAPVSVALEPMASTLFSAAVGPMASTLVSAALEPVASTSVSLSSGLVTSEPSRSWRMYRRLADSEQHRYYYSPRLGLLHHRPKPTVGSHYALPSGSAYVAGQAGILGEHTLQSRFTQVSPSVTGTTSARNPRRARSPLGITELVGGGLRKLRGKWRGERRQIVHCPPALAVAANTCLSEQQCLDMSIASLAGLY